MKDKVFISGSISIRTLPEPVKNSLDNIIKKNMQILIGDAEGIDTLVQKYCMIKKYFDIKVYTIKESPRFKADKNFDLKIVNVPNEIKKERERQQQKDIAMTKDSDYCFIIWDCKSKGSYANIIRAIEYKKKIKLYITDGNRFIERKKINKLNIEFIYREHNGYTASEIITILNEGLSDYFKRAQDLNKFLIKKSVLKKDGNVYLPKQPYTNLFIVEKFRGKNNNLRFKSEFIDWIEKEIKSNKLNKTYIQRELFNT